jgi:tRNA threonylcarbamoyladenosine biosynthesis protein TsaB
MNNVLILGLETSGILCSVAWWQRHTILLEYNIERKHAHAANLANLITKGHKTLGIDAQAISLVAIGCGPGSFTGLRIGMAYAKGFCFGRGIPLIPVTNFEVLAALAENRQKPVYTLIEARHDLYYTGVFSQKEGRLTEKYLAEKKDLIAAIPADAQIIVHEENQKGGFKAFLGPGRSVIQGEYKSSLICEIGYRTFITQENLPLDQIEPLYLQAFAGVS